MTRRRRHRCARRRPTPTTAFTLIELLVVIGLMALLISFLLPALSAVRSKNIAAREASLQRHQPTPTPTAEAGEPDIAGVPATRLPASVRSFEADVTLTPRLSVGTLEPESIYEAALAAQITAVGAPHPDPAAEQELRLPLPPQIISLAGLSVTVNGEPSDAVTIEGESLVWRGPLPTGDVPVLFDVAYTAVGRGLYELNTPPGRILERFRIGLAAVGSDVRMLELSLQPTSLSRDGRTTRYAWDYSNLMFGRPIAVDVLGIAPVDRLGELSWLGPLSVALFGLLVGLVARAQNLEQFDRWMLILVLGTFTGAYPLMYFAQEYVPLRAAMIGSAALVLLVIAVRTTTIVGWRVGLLGITLPAAGILGLTLTAAVRPQLQGILLTALALGLFVVAMTLAPRLHVTRALRPPFDPTPAA